MAIALNKDKATAAIQDFFSYIQSELSINSTGDDYDLLPGESSGLCRISSSGLDPRPGHKSGPNRDFIVVETSILWVKAIQAKSSISASAEVAGDILILPSLIAAYANYSTYAEGFYQVAWDQRKITPVPRSPLKNQAQDPRWLVNTVFGAVLYFQFPKSPLGIYK